MKDNTVKEMVQYLQQQIGLLISTRNILDEREKEKMIRNINNLMEQSEADVRGLVSDDLANEYEQELTNAIKLLNSRGVKFSTSLDSVVHKGALEYLLQDTMLDMRAAYRTANKRLVDNIEETLGSVKKDIADGVMYGNTRQKTVKRVYDDFLEKGLTSFTTVDGKELPLDFYAETVTRTKTSTARIKAHSETYKEAGVNLMEVVGASDPCPKCGVYQGKVFSTDGQDKRFPHVDVQNVFPLHPNCRCSVLPYIPDFEEEKDVQSKIDKSSNFDPTKDTRTEKQKKAYKDMQDARRKARQEMKDYDKIKGVLGDDAPKTLGAYRRMKREKSKGYLKLQSKMRALNKKAGS